MNINKELVIVDLKNGIAEFDLSYNIDQKGIDWVSEELASNPYFAGMHADHVEARKKRRAFTVVQGGITPQRAA